MVRACLDASAMVLFCSPIKIPLFLPFQNREKILSTAEMVTQWNRSIVAKQALKEGEDEVVMWSMLSGEGKGNMRAEGGARIHLYTP